MLAEALRLYVRRKVGWKQKPGWIVRSYLPSLLILFITTALVFALIFVSSISAATDEALQLLGYGSVMVQSEVPSELLPSDAQVFTSSSSSALASSESDVALLSLKGVEEGYFTAEKAEFLRLSRVENDTSLRNIILSSLTASALGVSPGDRLTVLIYDEELGRARPVYLFVSGTYSSGYSEFDSALAFTDSSVTSGTTVYEILTAEDPDRLVATLRESGYNARSYREIYPALWQNINLSVALLDVIVVFVALLAGFFAISISAEYIDRDSRDIASMMISGCSSADIVTCYRRITLYVTLIASVLGSLLGIGLSYALMPLISSLDPAKYPALQNYVLSFKVLLPLPLILILLLALLLSAYVSLRLSLKRYVSSSLSRALISA